MSAFRVQYVKEDIWDISAVSSSNVGPVELRVRAHVYSNHKVVGEMNEMTK